MATTTEVEHVWVTNSRDKHGPPSPYALHRGEPRGSAYYTVEDMKAMGYAGWYKTMRVSDGAWHTLANEWKTMKELGLR